MIGWLPNLKDGRPLKVLCLGAHSDDIEIGCGGTLLKLINDFHSMEIRWEVFSGQSARADEAAASAQWWLRDAASSSINLHDFRDGFFPVRWQEIKEQFEAIKAVYEPDLVFTHFRNDLHQDHRIINELTWNTFRNHSILEYEIPKYDGDLAVPNFYVPLDSDTAKAKVEGLMCHFKTQTAKHWFSEDLFSGLMRVRGVESSAASGFAEAFHARKICMG